MDDRTYGAPTWASPPVTPSPDAPVDLHAHTTASDGALDPAALVALAAERGLAALALTDHDTTAGYDEACAAGTTLGVEIIAAVEINTTDAQGGHTDILGYLLNVRDRPLQSLLSDIRDARIVRAQRMVSLLQALGARLDYEDVLRHAGTGAVGRPHVARALAEAGFVDSVGAAFQRYIGNDGPAYVDRFKITPAEACRVVRAAGGVPVVAHPVPPRDPFSDPKKLRSYLGPLVDAGLGGLECRYPGYRAGVVRWLESLASFFELVPTGGSDFHGPWRPENALGGVLVRYETITRLRDAAHVVA